MGRVKELRLLVKKKRQACLAAAPGEQRNSLQGQPSPQSPSARQPSLGHTGASLRAELVRCRGHPHPLWLHPEPHAPKPRSGCSGRKGGHVHSLTQPLGPSTGGQAVAWLVHQRLLCIVLALERALSFPQCRGHTRCPGSPPPGCALCSASGAQCLSFDL